MPRRAATYEALVTLAKTGAAVVLSVPSSSAKVSTDALCPVPEQWTHFPPTSAEQFWVRAMMPLFPPVPADAWIHEGLKTWLYVEDPST